MSNEQLSEHITEERLHEWLDNELTRRSSTVVSEHIQHCHECAELLEVCRDMRASVSQLLSSYDSEMSAVPRAVRSGRAKLAASSRAPSAPIINHIVVFSKPAEFWPTARRLTSMAALALVFVGTASMVLARSYHSVVGSVSSFARPGSVGASSDAGLFGVFEFLRPIFSSKAANSRVDVGGRVTSETGRGIGGVQISIRGTDMKTVSDFGGHYRFHGVPKSATAFDVTGVMGYASRVQYVNLYDTSEPVVDIRLHAGALNLQAFVVTSEMPDVSAPVSAPAPMCLTAFEPFSATDSRMFQGMRGRVLSEGNFKMELIDWPSAGKITLAKFTQESANTLLGQAQQANAIIHISLTRDGSVWRGSANETRDGSSRWRRVSLRLSSCPR